jgi:hypothetical protein
VLSFLTFPQFFQQLSVGFFVCICIVPLPACHSFSLFPLSRPASPQITVMCLYYFLMSFLFLWGWFLTLKLVCQLCLFHNIVKMFHFLVNIWPRFLSIVESGILILKLLFTYPLFIFISYALFCYWAHIFFEFLISYIYIHYCVSSWRIATLSLSCVLSNKYDIKSVFLMLI